MYLTFLCTAALVITTSQALVGTVCKVESECDAGECCQKRRLSRILSKKQDELLETTDPFTKTGTCQTYKTVGDQCGGFGEINGDCGCAPGTYCHEYWLTTTENTRWLMVDETTTEKVKRLVMDRPGFVSECEKRTSP
ncbi:hypothetical protein Btru_014917 [Bulinus truncatus]|nr:hypothetical protein Btru_014917 [Bulinus truncatus]